MPFPDGDLGDLARWAAVLWTACTAGIVWIVWHESREQMDDPTRSSTGQAGESPSADEENRTVEE